MIFFLLLIVAMFFSLVLQHFIGPLPQIGAPVLLMPIVMFYGALALPTWGMLALAFIGGLMWDCLSTQWTTVPTASTEGNVEIAMGWSIILYAVLGAVMSGFRPLFLRGRWEIHCLLTGLCTAFIVLAEYLMLTIRREPVIFVFNREIWWRIGGAGLVATFLSPLFFFALNYLAALVGYDPNPERKPGI
jgi:hypothetical protein